jgi:glycosyltransferase involved in cell wall biosynthesis
MSTKNVKVLLLTKYGNLGASSRVRSYQYLKYLERNKINVTISELFSNEYLEILYTTDRKSKAIILFAYIRRFFILLNAIVCKKYDVFWIEKELFPWAPFFIEAIFYKTKTPVFVDYDDPIFHFYDNHKNILARSILGGKISKIISKASHVSVSSHYMYDYAKKSAPQKLSIIPPAVNIGEFENNNNNNNNNICVIGWIGSPSATIYLKTIEEALVEVNLNNEVKFVLIGAGRDTPKSIPFDKVVWTEETEVESMAQFDIGIMPLSNDFSSLARDHYKLVKYMASSIPYVTSPVRESLLVTENGVNGFIANNLEEWVSYLSMLVKDHQQRKIMGKKGFLIAKKNYSTEIVHKQIVEALTNIK